MYWVPCHKPAMDVIIWLIYHPCVELNNTLIYIRYTSKSWQQVPCQTEIMSGSDGWFRSEAGSSLASQSAPSKRSTLWVLIHDLLWGQLLLPKTGRRRENGGDSW